MNHQLATYIDFIQSIGFISIFVLVLSVIIRLLPDNNKNDYIDFVKIRVDE